MTRRGRPPLDPDDPSVLVSVRVTSKQFDATQKQADHERMTMAAWIRKMLARGSSVHKNRD